MATSPSIDRHTFLANLRQSGLLSDEELAALSERLPATERGKVLARALVQQGILTRFQAEQILAGRTNGFVLGQYRIVDEIGKGGMGRVFKAIHQTMNRVVALKVLAPQLVETEKAQQLFQREMRAVARLMHPNLVTAYDANQLGSRYYLVMEYVDGPNLDRLVRTHGPLPASMACEIIRQAAEGLHYAFDMGMVHRDIKPSNILVAFPGGEPRRKRCVVKLLDFGLARLQTGDDETYEAGTILTRPNMVMGTPDFVSPEQARNLHSVDIRSDLYGLGCTFYYLLTGRVPFPGGGTLEKLIRHTTEEPVPVEKLRPDVSPEIAAIVLKLMAKEPAARFQTPMELATALEPYSMEIAGWPPSKSSVPAPEEEAAAGANPEDAFITPTLGGNPEGEFQFPTADEASALVNTVPPDVSPTLLSGTKILAATRSRRSATERKRIKLAIGVAIAVMAGLIGLAALFALLP
jgi:serine/threonine protein kinase